jgi:hypothetical protein
LLNAVTRREMANVAGADGSRFQREVEPRTNYFVGRVKKDYRGGDVVLGGIASSVARRLGDSALRERLNTHAEAVGSDLVVQWDARNYSLFANAELSNVSGEPGAILRAQRSSARYYQRPDRTFRHGSFLSGFYDSTATSMQGLASYLRLAKDGGNLNWEAQVNSRTPGFEVNDISFLSRADYVQTIANLSYNWTIPTRWYRNLSYTAGAQQQKTYEGILNNRDVHVALGGTTPQFWSWSGWAVHMFPTFDERLLRGGPVAAVPSLDLASVNITTDSRRAVVLNTNPQFQRSAEGAFLTRLNANVRWKPVSNVSASFGPSYQFSRGMQQYVTSVDDPTNAAFYGRRYILSSIVQKTLSLDTRLAVTFSPTSTLELYAQPFLASGAYSAFKEFDAPRQLRKSVYGIDRGTIAPTRGADGGTTSYTIDPDASGPAAPFTIGNPDFNLRSLRGNAVYRWEYRPGSTLFFVWTQSRNDYVQNVGTFDLERDRSALFATHPDNIFLVKVNYWMGR